MKSRRGRHYFFFFNFKVSSLTIKVHKNQHQDFSLPLSISTKPDLAAQAEGCRESVTIVTPRAFGGFSPERSAGVGS